ncbi:hypothetical protein [uncultured Meiothermus sp.]|uniref:hypothetical protein n=1 Tax=uncultured Meiothermus sp. TaxID=157471 RepID=UPI002630C10C|nr:hypothetical protein [uncultured Meiothermus sp.]
MKEDSKSRESSLVPLYVSILGILLITVLFGVIAFSLFGNWEKASNFGNAFGTLNTLFSGLAFTVLIYTILLQRRELSLQRQELAMTRKELSGQKEALQLQNELTSKLQFESSFFRVLRTFQDTARNLIGDTKHGSQQGQMFFLSLIVDFSELVSPSRHFANTEPQPTVSFQVDKNSLPLSLKDAIPISMNHSLMWLQSYVDTLHLGTILLREAPVENTGPYKNLLLAQLSIRERLVLVIYSNKDQKLEEICDFLRLSEHITDAHFLDSAERNVYMMAKEEGLI